MHPCARRGRGRPRAGVSALSLCADPPRAPGLLRPSCTAAGLGLFWHLSQTADLLVSWTQLLIQEVGYSFCVSLSLFVMEL